MDEVLPPRFLAEAVPHLEPEGLGIGVVQETGGCRVSHAVCGGGWAIARLRLFGRPRLPGVCGQQACMAPPPLRQPASRLLPMLLVGPHRVLSAWSHACAAEPGRCAASQLTPALLCTLPHSPAGILLSARHAAERFDACWHGGLATIEALREQMDALLREYLASGDFK